MMTTCPAYVDVGAYEPTEFYCSKAVDHEGHHLSVEDGMHLLFTEERASWPFTGPRLPHVCDDQCSPLHATLGAYVSRMMDNTFSATPFLYSVYVPLSRELVEDAGVVV